MWEELGYYEGLAQTWKAFLSLHSTDDAAGYVSGNQTNGIADTHTFAIVIFNGL